MDLSVVIPCYNAGEKVVKCIESVVPLAITISLEVIVVDDGSRDNSAMLIKELNLPFVRLIQKENFGVSSARNVGIDAATGTYLVFADADDYYIADKLLAVYNKAFSLSCDMLMFGYNYVTPNRVRRIALPDVASAEELKKQMVDTPFAKRYNSTYLTGRVYQYVFKRSSLTSRFDESLSYAEDLLFILDCLSNCGSLEFCNIYAYNYVYDGKSATNSYRLNYYNELKDMYSLLVSRGYTTYNYGYLYYMDRAIKNYIGRDIRMIEQIVHDENLLEILSKDNFNKWTISEKLRNDAILSNDFARVKLYYSVWRFCNNFRFFIIRIYTNIRGYIKRGINET